MGTIDALKKDLRELGTPEKTKASAWFFKNGPGQYGEGDVFIGVTVPEQRKIAKKYQGIQFDDIEKLLRSPEHEFRLTALLILNLKYQSADVKEQDRIARFYLVHTKCVNNWDLVDGSAPSILGHNLLDKKRSVLYKFALSKNLWERRMAIVATYAFIRVGQYDDTLNIAALLLSDQHDLIHKAVGWMLREVGNRSLPTEEQFLDQHVAEMPRTALRYAIEKFPATRRQYYMTMPGLKRLSKKQVS